jgi:hypothetical protein
MSKNKGGKPPMPKNFDRIGKGKVETVPQIIQRGSEGKKPDENWKSHVQRTSPDRVPPLAKSQPNPQKEQWKENIAKVELPKASAKQHPTPDKSKELNKDQINKDKS